MEPFLGQVQIFGFNFAPRGWAFCDGTLLAISTNTALFSLLGTVYGGNGVTTFALPDLRGRTPIHPGQGPGLSPIVQGEMSGGESVTLLISNMPAHNHIVMANSNNATEDEPGSNVHFGSTSVPIYTKGSPGNVPLAPDSTTMTGGSVPVGIRNPYLGIYYSIALQGIFPSRN